MCSRGQGFPAPGSGLCPEFRKAEYPKRSQLQDPQKSESLEIKAVSMALLELHPEFYPKPGACWCLEHELAGHGLGSW